MVTVICFCTSYEMILGFTMSWEYCCSYLIFMICYANVVIPIDLHSQSGLTPIFWIYPLVVMCIETRILFLVPQYIMYLLFL